MASGFSEIEFVEFHENELPDRIAAGHGPHAFAASRALAACSPAS